MWLQTFPLYKMLLFGKDLLSIFVNCIIGWFASKTTFCWHRYILANIGQFHDGFQWYRNPSWNWRIFFRFFTIPMRARFSRSQCKKMTCSYNNHCSVYTLRISPPIQFPNELYLDPIFIFRYSANSNTTLGTNGHATRNIIVMNFDATNAKSRELLSAHFRKGRRSFPARQMGCA